MLSKAVVSNVPRSVNVLNPERVERVQMARTNQPDDSSQ